MTVSAWHRKQDRARKAWVPRELSSIGGTGWRRVPLRRPAAVGFTTIRGGLCVAKAQQSCADGHGCAHQRPHAGAKAVQPSEGAAAAAAAQL